jgi:putative ABC transport system permease protein
MSRVFHLAWRYLVFHRVKTTILLTAITLILYLPAGLRVLVEQSARQLRARAVATPLILGAKGSPLELVLDSLYFRADRPESLAYTELAAVEESGFAQAVPLYTRFQSRGHPIVGTTLDYFSFRGLNVENGRMMAILGECVLGSRVAGSLQVGPGDALVSSPESVFDLAGIYPLKMSVVGVLAPADSADDDAIFVDLKTAWIIEGLGHGHQDLRKREAASGVLGREGNKVIANASVVQYNEITERNIDTFHFHGDLGAYPITSVLLRPHDQKSSALLQGRYQAAELPVQIVVPAEVMDDLLATILTVERFVVGGALILGLATLATTALVFWLSLRLRRREIDTLFKIGGSRFIIASVMASEIVIVLVGGMILAGAGTWLTGRFGALVIRWFVQY